MSRIGNDARTRNAIPFFGFFLLYLSYRGGFPSVVSWRLLYLSYRGTTNSLTNTTISNL